MPSQPPLTNDEVFALKLQLYRATPAQIAEIADTSAAPILAHLSSEDLAHELLRRGMSMGLQLPQYRADLRVVRVIVYDFVDPRTRDEQMNRSMADGARTQPGCRIRLKTLTGDVTGKLKALGMDVENQEESL